MVFVHFPMSRKGKQTAGSATSHHTYLERSMKAIMRLHEPLGSTATAILLQMNQDFPGETCNKQPLLHALKNGVEKGKLQVDPTNNYFSLTVSGKQELKKYPDKPASGSSAGCSKMFIGHHQPSQVTYLTKIIMAIAEGNERHGSSLDAIKKGIHAQSPDHDIHAPAFRKALKQGLEDDLLVKVKASYKLSRNGRKYMVSHRHEMGLPSHGSAAIVSPLSTGRRVAGSGPTVSPKAKKARVVKKK